MILSRPKQNAFYIIRSLNSELIKFSLFSLVFAHNYFLGLPPALEYKYVSVDVFNTNPVGERQSGVSPNPVHHSPQLRQEGNQTETGGGDKKKKLVYKHSLQCGTSEPFNLVTITVCH